MNTVISLLILFTFNSLNEDIYSEIAQYILKHLDKIESISAKDLAYSCHTSISTLNKFLDLIGIESFKKLKSLLSSTRKGRLEQIEYRYAHLNEDNIINSIELLSQNHINKEILKEDIEKLINYIYQSKNIYLFGAIFPLSLSLNFIEDMYIFGKPIYLKQMNFKNNVFHFNQDDLLIIMTITGRFLTQNRQSFLNIYQTSAKKVIISQNNSFSSFHLDLFIKLFGEDDHENENLVLLEILNLVKYKYFVKYINNNEIYL